MPQDLQSTDKLIRPLVRSLIEHEHTMCVGYKIYEEFSIWGGGIRADFAALNGISRGYEIKSGKDTLDRLERQRSAYNKIFDEVTIIADLKHISDLRRFPRWWGIVQVQGSRGKFSLVRLRESMQNPKKDSVAIASLLWRDEAMAILQEFGLDSGVKTKPMGVLIARLSDLLPTEVLAGVVRRSIRSRGDWLAAARQK